jgi:peptide/nickel transport system permease protein
MMIAIGLSHTPGFARVVRASVLSVKENEYIESARLIGDSDIKIIFKHILPNAMAPMIVQATLNVGRSVISAASLSFLGLGIQPPIPEWGSMLSSARSFLRDYWWMTTFPGLTIMTTVFSLNLVGDGLRDALDPRLKN